MSQDTESYTILTVTRPAGTRDALCTPRGVRVHRTLDEEGPSPLLNLVTEHIFRRSQKKCVDQSQTCKTHNFAYHIHWQGLPKLCNSDMRPFVSTDILFCF